MPTAPVSHAKLSPSGAHRWLRCSGSLLAESLVPNESSEYADEGSVAHEVAAMTLNSDHKNAEAFLGRTITLKDNDGNPLPDKVFEVTQDMCCYVQEYVDGVLDYARGGKLLVETRVDFSDILGIPDSYGTADCIVLKEKELHVHDLKYGYRPVYAKDNEQLMLYALGALEMFDLADEIEQITLAIHMPRKDGVNDWSVTKADVYAFAEKVKEKAARAVQLMKEGHASDDAFKVLLRDGVLVPGGKQCQWCNFAKEDRCPALRNEVISTVTAGEYTADELLAADELEPGKMLAVIEEDTEEVHQTGGEYLSKCLTATDLVDLWVKSVRETAASRLENGEAVPGYKLVRGRKGPRKWVSETAAEEALKSMRFKQNEMYDFKVISPTTAESRLKDSPRRWSRLKVFITQSDGSLSVAPEHDKRPAVVMETAKDDELAHGAPGLTVEDLV